MIMFCGLPVIVAVEPTFEAIATANRYGTGLRSSARVSSMHERRHHQTDRVVDQKGREHAGHQHDGGQEQRRVTGARHGPGADQPEEAGQAQVGDHDHHAEQERDRVEVDGAVGVLQA